MYDPLDPPLAKVCHAEKFLKLMAKVTGDAEYLEFKVIIHVGGSDGVL